MRPSVEEDVLFIETDLLPEMVHNRCFCEPNSREFVEFESAKIEPLELYRHYLDFALYRATVVIQFSGEPQTFHVLVKLLPEDVSTEPSLALAYDGFLNEEIIWNKLTLQLGKDYFPRFFVADMGKYGRPVIVVEDLEQNGFERVIDRELNEEEARSVLELIGSFHGKSMALRETKPTVFREFEAKFQEITFAESGEAEIRKKYTEFAAKQALAISDELAEMPKELADEVLGSDDYARCKKSTLTLDESTCVAICQGLLLRENLWFKKSSDGKVEEVRALDWQRLRCGSNCLDLTTILTQVEDAADRLDELLDVYLEAVLKERPEVKREKLLDGLAEPGLPYASLVSLLGSQQLPDIATALPESYSSLSLDLAILLHREKSVHLP